MWVWTIRGRVGNDAIQRHQRAQIVERPNIAAQPRNEDLPGARGQQVAHVAFTWAQRPVRQGDVEAERLERGRQRRLDSCRTADVQPRDHADHGDAGARCLGAWHVRLGQYA